MMDLTWFILGLCTTGSIIYIYKLSKQFKLNWIAYSGYCLGVFLVLFSIAWSVGAVLEGVPRAGSMGLLVFGLPGIVILTLVFRYITTKLRTEVAVSKSSKIENIDYAEKTLASVPSKTIFERFGLAIKYGAYLSLVIAFVIGFTSQGKNYEAMVSEKFKDQKVTKINSDPVIFQLGDKKDNDGEFILIQEGQGYGGPFVLGIRIHEDSKVHEVFPLEHKETPAFAKKVDESDFREQFINKHISDNFIVGNDIDAVSGATVTTMAATQAIRNGAHIAAVEYFSLEPSWIENSWKFGIGEILILIIFILAFFPKLVNKTPYKYIYMFMTISVVGFYLNASISIGNIAAVAIGYIPSFQEHIIWWVLVMGTLLVILMSGKNIYCNRVCPFYAVEFLLQKISGTNFKPSKVVIQRANLVMNFLLWLSLMIIFLTKHPALGAYEPFAMMFSLEGIGVQWYILPFAVIGSFFTSSFWCRFFCPVGAVFRNLIKLRKFLISLVPLKNKKG